MARDFGAASVGSNCELYASIEKLKTPHKLSPSVRVGAMRPISSGGTAVERRVFHRSMTLCIFMVFQAITMLTSKLSVSDQVTTAFRAA